MIGAAIGGGAFPSEAEIGAIEADGIGSRAHGHEITQDHEILGRIREDA
jgi:hypothetical protein